MSDHDRKALSVSLASCLLEGRLSTYHALALVADDDVILRSVVLFRAMRASMR